MGALRNSNHDELLRAYLAERDVGCGRCGYNLRGLEGDRCPECGWRAALGVHEREYKSRLYGFGIWLLAACLAALCVIGVVRFLPNARFRSLEGALFGMLYVSAIQVAWMAARPVFQRSHRLIQLAALGGVLLSGAASVLLAVTY